jgi:hypothetical protein
VALINSEAFPPSGSSQITQESAGIGTTAIFAVGLTAGIADASGSEGVRLRIFDITSFMSEGENVLKLPFSPHAKVSLQWVVYQPIKSVLFDELR